MVKIFEKLNLDYEEYWQVGKKIKIKPGDWVPVFKTGKYPQFNEPFTKEKMDAMINRFKEEAIDSPLTFDHAKRGPAYGWFSDLKRDGEWLLAKVKEIHADAKNSIEKGYYRFVSPEIYEKWRGGAPRFRAVSLLGAQIPEQKDLPLVLFEEYEGEYPVCLFQEYDMEEAMDEKELQKENEELKKQLAEANVKITEFSEENEKTKTELKQMKVQAQEQKAKDKDDKISNFVEKLRKEGKLPPKDEENTKAFMRSLDDEKLQKFSEADGTFKEKSQLDQYMDQLNAKEPVLNFGEEIITDKPDRQFDFDGDSDMNLEGLKLFSEVEKRAKEQNVPKSDVVKINELTQQVIDEWRQE